MKWADLENKPIVIWGLGREGLAVLEHLPANVESILLIDDNEERRTEAANMASTNGFERLIAVETKDARPNIVENAIVVKSPGISRYSELAESLVTDGITITSSTDIWLSERNGKKVIGVTGSKGKSTTTSLITHLLRSHGNEVSIGGNIGVPLIELPTEKDHWCVAEISSFQASDVTVSPEIGVLTSLFEEHLDWHLSYENYVNDKLNLFSHDCAALFVNAPDDEAMNKTKNMTNREVVNVKNSIVWHDGNNVYFQGQLIANSADLPIAGGHNLSNVVLALAAAARAIPQEIQVEVVSEALLTFEPLPYRMQKIGSFGSAIVIDDGLATNPGASAAAISMFGNGPTAFFLGGYDRGINYEPLAQSLSNRQHKTYAYLMGPAGKQIAELYAKKEANPNVELIEIDQLIDGIEHAVAHASELDAIVLSPGGASFNEFTDYKERSDIFQAEMLARGMEIQSK